MSGRASPELEDDATEIGEPSGTSAGAVLATGRRREPGRFPEPGERVGHFVVQALLGVGGMGVVLRVHDERLARDVALKLVRPGLDTGAGHTRGTERLLVEARAMAKVSHPNVITVYEVGVVEGQVFLAMEFIDGFTLGDWAKDKRRSWRELVERWSTAGRGLAAAHAAGLVHRDFKPANVLVARDGRTLVTDFGIASSSLDEHEDEYGDEASAEQGAAAGPVSPVTSAEHLSREVSRLTQTGGLLGTPRYMAPEQYLAQRVDARADQFAFCVSLWEAVYARHPFDAETAPALVLAVTTGALREPERQRGVPTQLRRILLRGLATQPADRYPDLDALLVDLDDLLRRIVRRRRVLPVALAVPALAAGAWALWPAPQDPCVADARRWAGVWDAAVEADITAAFASADAPYLRESWPRLRAELDAYVTAWDAHARAACEDTRVRETISEQLLDQRMSCLDSSQRNFAALTRHLRVGEVLEDGFALVSDLPSLDACDDLTRLATQAQVPPQLREELVAFDEMLAEVNVLSYTTSQDDLLAILEPWRERVEAMGRAEAQARYHRSLAHTYYDTDRRVGCDHYYAAYPFAVESGDVMLASEVALNISTCRSETSADDRGDFWIDVARSGYAKLGRPLDFGFHVRRMTLHYRRRDLDAAIAAGKVALTVVDEHTEPHSVLALYGNLGGLLVQQRQFDEARGYIDKAIELASEHYGPRHLNTLTWRANAVGMRFMQGGDVEEALAMAKEVLVAQREGLGQDALPVAVTLTLMGLMARQLERVEEATAYDREALAIREAGLSATHPLTLESREKLARDYVLSERYDEGLAELRELVELLVQRHGAEHQEVGLGWNNLGWGLAQAGRFDEAVEAQRRAYALVHAANPDHALMYEIRGALGEYLLELEQFEAALDELEHARELCLAHNATPTSLAGVLFDLARARAGARRAEAEAPAREALALLDEHAPESGLRAQVVAWLEAR